MTDLHDPRGEMFVSERPWGNFQQYTHNEPTTVKVITVAPGQRLSLQIHQHRGEFWQVLDGPLDVTVGEATWSAAPGEQVWVPRGERHRVGNSGEAPGRLLEIAWGSFDEEDIVRLADDYQR